MTQTMTAPAATKAPTVADAITQAVSQLQGASGATSTSSSSATQAAARLLDNTQTVLRSNPELLAKAKPKAFDAGISIDPADVAQKSWWSDLTEVIATTVPVLVSAV